MKRSVHPQLITLLIKQNSIVLACAEYSSQDQMPKGTLIKELAPFGTFINGRIFNYELAFSTLTTYIDMMHYDKPIAGIIFDTPLIRDSFDVADATLITQNFLGSYHTQNLAFGSFSDELSFAYTASIGCELILQYELLCNALKLPLVFISTPFQAYIKAYQVLYGAAFRQSMLFDAMARYGTELHESFDQSVIARLIRQPSWDVSMRDNLLCIGSFYCMKELL